MTRREIANKSLLNIEILRIMKKSVYSRLVIMVMAGLFSAITVMAEDAGWVSHQMYFGQRATSSSSWNHAYQCSSDCGTTGVAVKALGVGEQFSFDTSWVTVWSNSGKGNVCVVRMWWTIGSGWGMIDGYSAGSAVGNNTTWSKNPNYVFANSSSLNPGNYTLQYKYEATMNGYGTDCPSTWSTIDNGGSNYRATFTIPGLKASDYSTTVKYKSGIDDVKTYSFYAYGMSSCTATITNDGTGGYTAFTFDGSSSREKSGISVSSLLNSGSFSIHYKPTAAEQNHTAWLTISGTASNGKAYSKKVKLTGASKSSIPTTVYIAADADVRQGPVVTLYGYLKHSGCRADITTYGFKYSTTANVSTIKASSTKVEKTGVTLSDKNRDFDGTIIEGLLPNTDYYYMPYVISGAGTTYSKNEAGTEVYGHFRTKGLCQFQDADVIEYTIDKSLPYDDPCELKFRDFATALADLKRHTGSNNDDWWNSESKLLKVNVVFNVAEGEYGTSGGWISFDNINAYDGSASVPTKTFTIRALPDQETKPVIYGMNLENSRWITVDGMNIKRDDPAESEGITHSAILVGLKKADNNLTVGVMHHAGIKFINCDIEGNNFASLHIQGIDGFYMENCNLVAGGAASRDTYNWGASIKFMNSKNITLLRNNFKGAHATNIFAQNVEYMLVMNNVFWNDNAVKKGSWSTPNNDKAFIRLIKYESSGSFSKINHIGMYYNTLYLADNTASGYSEYTDFLTLGGTGDGDPDQTHTAASYDFNTIEFMYNNCYSYDKDTPGRRTTSGYEAFCGQNISSSTHITSNNFWAHNGSTDYSNAFAFGANQYKVNVKDMVCETAPNTPEELVIKESGLNKGVKLSSDISGLGGESIMNDRVHETAIRPASGAEWTLGAYQQSEGVEVDAIYWRGSLNSDKSPNTDWDYRGNWIKKVNGKDVVVTCVDILPNTLHVIIPAPNSEMKSYPEIPAWAPVPSEGVRIGDPMDKFANTIELEYGASIKGTENLYGHYDEAVTHLEAGRNEWILVGSTVSPMKSGNYYKNNEPHVYMQHITEDDKGNIVPGVPFSDTEQNVALQSAYMIRLPNQYGYYKIPAEYYYKDGTGEARATESIEFTFRGSFSAANESGLLPKYTGLDKTGKFNFVNNYYTANLDIYNVLSDESGKWKAKYYDYDASSFKEVVESGIYIKPQGGFVLYANTDNLPANTYVQPAENRYVFGATYYKGASADDMVKIKLSNTADNKNSVIYVKHFGSNSPKAFGWNESTPELYMIDGDNMYDVFIETEQTKRIPLGVRNASTGLFSIKFQLEKYLGFDEVVLEDVLYDEEYDLTETSPIFMSIAPGDNEGRFFLRLKASEDDTPTDVSEEAQDDTSINMFVDRNMLTVSVSRDAKLKSITLTDMSGRSWSLTPNDSNYSQHKLDVDKGVYIVTAVTDKTTSTEKIIIKR